jgi:choloylglycine hydrolase
MCTGIFAVTKDNKYIFGRTLEFGIPLTWKQFRSLKIKGTIGMFKGINKWYMTDGVNTNGLFVGTFYFPHYNEEYSKNKIPDKINIETGEVNSFLLKHCTSVDDVIKLASKLNILETILHNIACSFHWIICDKTGRCIVMEVSKQKVMIYDNPYNVLTNSPSFDKQVSNLKKYHFLSKYNKPNSTSQGSGALGMPGDSTSPSRFVRAHFYRKNMALPKNSEIGIESILRILHNFDIPLGSVEDKKTKELEVTEYTVAYCLNNQCVRYAPYGYIEKNKKWIQTNQPVKLNNDEISNVILGCMLIFGCILYKSTK